MTGGVTCLEGYVTDMLDPMRRSFANELAMLRRYDDEVSLPTPSPIPPSLRPSPYPSPSPSLSRDKFPDKDP